MARLSSADGIDRERATRGTGSFLSSLRSLHSPGRYGRNGNTRGLAALFWATLSCGLRLGRGARRRV